MLDIEDKILEALKELERWENRREKVKTRIQNDEGDVSELERIEEMEMLTKICKLILMNCLI